MIHYHGTPLTPRTQLQRLQGKHFCVSFARPDDLDWCLANGQSVMLDNGAYSLFTKGVEANWTSYYSMLESRLSHPHWAVIPDVIDGEASLQRKLRGQWPFGYQLGAPVWHMGLPLEELLRIAEVWPRLCFGSTAQYWEVGSDTWSRRCDEAFNALERQGYRPWVHMLRGMNLAGDVWPFASVDSTNVARNFKRNKVCPERMARRLDAIQGPTRWVVQPGQEMLI